MQSWVCIGGVQAGNPCSSLKKAFFAHSSKVCLAPLKAPCLRAPALQLAIRMGANPGQYKPPVVLGKPSQVELLDARVLASARACS